MDVTGNQIREIRKMFGWSIEQFARMLGVHPVTLNRWELAGDQVPPVEGMAGAILLGLRQRMIDHVEGKRAAKARAKAAADEMEKLLVVGGVLLALGAMLAFVNEGKR